MQYNLSEIIPAIRMLASKNEIQTVSFIDSDTLIDSFNKLVQEGYNVDKNEVLEINQFNSVETLKDTFNSWYKEDNQSPSFVVIKEIGAVVLANNPANANGLLENKPQQFQYPVYGRMSGKICVITGGAQGFGAGIAEMLFEQGANIVIADINKEAANQLIAGFNAKGTANKAAFVKTNVADPESVKALIDSTVKIFGGIDVMISNAGVLRAGGLDEMDADTFRFMTDINYSGYFNCAKYASAVMKVQTAIVKDYFCDIIQINSKSGLQGSKKNFAYAGGKFGGIGLTQSFALELMPDNVKVNSICPGNFFEGPLWSDPEKGLFVQYLNAGKVPGAKSVEDVKHFYEKQVPAGRGCRVIDVARAIMYVVEQEYETGQAIPVTGGQTMLH